MFATSRNVIPGKLAPASATLNPGYVGRLLDSRFHGNDDGTAVDFFSNELRRMTLVYSE
ncbi:MAG: hypothetical protein ACREQV_26855 [Candidatus Binatia bacterium]